MKTVSLASLALAGEFFTNCSTWVSSLRHMQDAKGGSVVWDNPAALHKYLLGL